MLSHFYWKYFEPESFTAVEADEAHLYGEIIPNYYRLVDRVLAGLLRHVSPSTTVLVVSDHGLRAGVELNTQRYFPRVKEILRDLELQDECAGIFLGARTYIEPVSTDSVTARTILDEVAETLTELKVEESGEPVFELLPPDGMRLAFVVARGVESDEHHVKRGDRLITLKEWVLSRPGVTGVHDPGAIFIGRGPGIKPAARLTGASILDVTPTAFYLMGKPLSREFDGEVIWQAIDEDFRSRHELAWVDTYGAVAPVTTQLSIDPETEDRLRGLGYLR